MQNIEIVLTKNKHSKESIMGGLLMMRDKFWTNLDIDNSGDYLVTLIPKDDDENPLSEAEVKEEFDKQVVFQKLRQKIFDSTVAVKQSILNKALAGTPIQSPGVPSFLFDDDDDEDIEDIATPWEEKYGSKGEK